MNDRSPSKKLPTWAVAVISVVAGLVVVAAIAVGIWFALHPIVNNEAITPNLNLKSIYSAPTAETRKLQTTWNAAKGRTYNLSVKGNGLLLKQVSGATSPSNIEFVADEKMSAFDPASIEVTLDMLSTDTLPAESFSVDAVAAPGEVFSECADDAACEKSSGYCNPTTKTCEWLPRMHALKSTYSAPTRWTRQLITTWQERPEETYELLINTPSNLSGTIKLFPRTVNPARSPDVLNLVIDQTIAGTARPEDFSVTLVSQKAGVKDTPETTRASGEPGLVYGACSDNASCSTSGFCDAESKCQWPTQTGPAKLSATFNAPTRYTRGITSTWKMTAGITYELQIDVLPEMRGTTPNTFPISVKNATSPSSTVLEVGTQISEQARPADVSVTIYMRMRPQDQPTIEKVSATAISGQAYSSCTSNADCTPSGLSCQMSDGICQWPSGDTPITPASFFDAPTATTRTLTTVWEPEVGRSYTVTIEPAVGSENVWTEPPYQTVFENATSPSMFNLAVPRQVAATARPSDFAVTITTLASGALPASTVRVIAQAVPGHEFSACSSDTDCVTTQYCNSITNICAAQPNKLRSYFTAPGVDVRQFDTTWVAKPGRTYRLIIDVAVGSQSKVVSGAFPIYADDISSPTKITVNVPSQVSADARPGDFLVQLEMTATATLNSEITTVSAIAEPGSVFSTCTTNTDCVTTKYCSPQTRTCAVFPAADRLIASYAMNPSNPTILEISLDVAVSPALSSTYPKNAVMTIQVYHNNKIIFQKSNVAFYPTFTFVYDRVGDENVAPASFSLMVVFADPVSGATSAPITLVPTPVTGSAYALCRPENTSCGAVPQCIGGIIAPVALAGYSCESACCDVSSMCATTTATSSALCEPALHVNRTLATDTYASFNYSGRWEVMISGSANERFSRQLSIVRADNGEPIVVIGNFDNANLFKAVFAYQTPTGPTALLDAFTLKLRVLTTDSKTDQQDEALYLVFRADCNKVGNRCTPRKYCSEKMICFGCAGLEDTVSNFTLTLSPSVQNSSIASVVMAWTTTDPGSTYIVQLFSSNSDILAYQEESSGDQNSVAVELPLAHLGTNPFASIHKNTSCALTRTAVVTRCDGFPATTVTAVLIATKPFVTVRVSCITGLYTVGTVGLTLRAYSSVMGSYMPYSAIIDLQDGATQHILLSAPPFNPILQLHVRVNTICENSSYTVPVLSPDFLMPCELNAATTMFSTQDMKLYAALQENCLIPGAEVSLRITLAGNPPREQIVPLVTSDQTGQVTAPVDILQGGVITDVRVFFAAANNPIMSEPPFVPQQCPVSPVLPVTNLTCVLDVGYYKLHLKWNYASPNPGSGSTLRIVKGEITYKTFRVPDLTTGELAFDLTSIEELWWYSDPTAYLEVPVFTCQGTATDAVYETQSGVIVAQAPLVAPSGPSAALFVGEGTISVRWNVPQVPPPQNAFNVVTLLDAHKVVLGRFQVPTLNCVLFETTFLRPISVTIQTLTPTRAQSDVVEVSLTSNCPINTEQRVPAYSKFYYARVRPGSVAVFKPVENVAYYKMTVYLQTVIQEVIIFTAGGLELASLPCENEFTLNVANPRRQFLKYDSQNNSYVYNVLTTKEDYDLVLFTCYNACFCVNGDKLQEIYYIFPYEELPGR